MSLVLLFHYLMLEMFRMLIHPSSGACDLFVELLKWSLRRQRVKAFVILMSLLGCLLRSVGWLVVVNPLTPNDPSMGRTALLKCKRCILYIYSTNIGTEYLKHGVYTLRVFLLKMQFVS